MMVHQREFSPQATELFSGSHVCLWGIKFRTGFHRRRIAPDWAETGLLASHFRIGGRLILLLSDDRDRISDVS
jgi:hypothetical protein